MRYFAASFLALTVLSCGESGPKITLDGAVDCNISNATLDGTQWVMLELGADGNNFENPMARLKFYIEDGVQKVKYSVKSPYQMYEYECSANEKEWSCYEVTHVQDWCQSLEVYKQGSCTREALEAMGASATDDEFDEGISDAMNTVNKYRGTDKFQHFKLNNNNLGNKLQGFLFAKMNEKKCQLSLTDMYMTIYDGKRVEDSNPVGTNPFVLNTDEWLWDACDDTHFLVDWGEETLPEDLSTIPRRRDFTSDQTIYFTYLGEKAIKAEEGCTYSIDTYAQWKPVAKDVPIAITEEGRIEWVTKHHFADTAALKLVSEQQPKGMFFMDRYQTCGGKKKQIDMLCSGSNISILEAPAKE